MSYEALSGLGALIRIWVATAAGKVVISASRGLRRGGGTALPGLVAECIAPDLIPSLAGRLRQGCVLITGTNGKTTTTRLVDSIAKAGGMIPVANKSGSNLMRGIATTLVAATDPLGRVSDDAGGIGLFEVDEAILPMAVDSLRPRVIAFTNLFRDQLDRYGEVEHVAAVWRKALARQDEGTVLVLNADDPSIAALADTARGPVIFYGLTMASGTKIIEHASDARWCLPCGQELDYSTVSYGHLGCWRCHSCGRERPQPEVEATEVKTTEGHLQMTCSFPEGCLEIGLPLMGRYNAYNALSAIAVGRALGLPMTAITEGISSFTAAFGRQERLRVDGREVQVILAKNPAGLNEVLRTITEGQDGLNVALFLNDKIADGRDVSWIWDVDFEILADHTSSVIVSGTRAEEMALRLRYAMVNPDPPLESNPIVALQRALLATPKGGNLYVVPTYTAMLVVREALARWGNRGHFWES